MKATKFGQNFFDSTRGRILDLIRSGMTTVDELARQLDLTGNAVRAHLSTLERDRLVEQFGTQRGTRKPHFSYRLTDEAEELFPKAYQALLRHLLHVLKLRLEPDLLGEILGDVARMLSANLPSGKADSAEGAARSAVAVLGELGGSARVEQNDDKLFIRSNAGCPFSDLVTEHPEICRLADALLTEITGQEVHEHCNRGARPQCTFEISEQRSPVA